MMIDDDDDVIKIVLYLQDRTASTASSVSRDATAMHLELIFVHHRVDCKLSLLKSGSVTIPIPK